MPLKHHEEVKAAVARMVDNCQSCKDDDFCQECREDIKHLQAVNDFDVTEYVSKTVPEDLTENTAGSDGDSSSPVSRSESQGEGAAQGSSSQRESPEEPPKAKDQEADDQHNLGESEEDFVLGDKTKTSELPTVGYKFVDENEGYSQYDGNLVKPVDATDSAGDLDESQRLEELTRKKDIHLWLADLKKTMDFDSREEAEGARKLVERAGWELGTHGYQILKNELEEGDQN